MIRTLRVKNIDSSKPVVEKIYKARERCSKCGILTEFKIRVVANERERVVGEISLKCETKMRGVKNAQVCGATIRHILKMVMPKGK